MAGAAIATTLGALASLKELAEDENVQLVGNYAKAGLKRLREQGQEEERKRRNTAVFRFAGLPTETGQKRKPTPVNLPNKRQRLVERNQRMSGLKRKADHLLESFRSKINKEAPGYDVRVSRNTSYVGTGPYWQRGVVALANPRRYYRRSRYYKGKSKRTYKRRKYSSHYWKRNRYDPAANTYGY